MAAGKPIRTGVLTLGCFIALMAPSALALDGFGYPSNPPDLSNSGYFTTSTSTSQMDGSYVWPSPLPGNQFFKKTDYEIDCNTGYPIGRFAGGLAGMIGSELFACRVLKAPVVGTSFLDELRKREYYWFVSFPYVNTNNQRAVLTWGRFGRACPVGGPCMTGYARLEGVDWQNQYRPQQFCTKEGFFVACRTMATFPFGDANGEFISALPSPDKEGGVRAVLFLRSFGNGGTQFGPSVVIDRWLGESASQASTSAPSPTSR